jgi:hypothetical protein
MVVTEGKKTLVAAAVALAVALVAFLTQPKDVEFTQSEVYKQIGKPLFPDFTDPGKAARLEIVRVNQELGQVNKFEVARDKKTDLWIIPSHNNYPADAEAQIRDVSLLFVDMKVQDIVTTAPEDHAYYGVVEPNEQTATSGSGVGTLVTVESRDGEKLVQLIVGKPSKNSSHNEHFVRRPGQDVVYLASIDTSKLTTKFEDWIEKDLLKLNAWDIADIRIQDYSVTGTIQQGVFGLTKRFDVTLKWDSSKGQWTLDKFVTFRGDRAIPAQMAPDEELNTTKLNDLKNALDDLQIVDVFRKPKGLGADLKAERGLLNDAEGVQSLVDKGFYPLASSGDQVELLSANGEIHVGMNDGVQYILRFGQTTQDANSGKLNRFLFVMATFDESRIPMPEKPAILNTPPAAAPQSSQQSGDQPSKTSDQQSGGSSQSSQNGEQNSQNDQAGTNSGGQQSGAADSSKSAPAGQQPSEEQEAERQKAQKEYQRKLDEREEKIKKGKQRARELNDRFADWYYVISEDMYRKIHLTRSDIFRTKTGTTEEGFGVDAFRALEKEGLKKSSTP